MFELLQTVENLIRCCVLQHLIWVCTVCQLLFFGVFSLQRVKERSDEDFMQGLFNVTHVTFFRTFFIIKSIYCSYLFELP